MKYDLTIEQLAKLLRDAEIAHADYERSIGRADGDWPRWYAEYMIAQLPEARWQ